MSGYKLVPVEPTVEMMWAAQEADMDHGDHDEWMELDGDDCIRMYKAMLAAAPAVQGEAGPVGWVWHSYNQTNFTSGSHHKEVLEADGVKLTPVYTAPPPAEQQPAPDVSALVEALECALETMENVDGANDCSRGINAVEEALAAHRKETAR